MRTENAAERLPITKIAVKGSCPICGAVKHFQEALLETLQPEGHTRLCNFHAWSLAKSAPAEVAASVLLDALRAREWDASRPRSCVACEKVHEEEGSRLKEITSEFESSTINGWLQQHARFCIRHMRELKSRVPQPLQKMIEDLRIKSASELEEELEEFLRQAKQGNHAGAGVLGRTAEYLVAQRGILD
jgi:hypothetical protein